MTKNLINSGFSLTEILVAMGLLSGISYGIMQMMSNSAKSQKSMEVKDSMSQLHRELIVFLSSEQNCSESMGANNNKKNGDTVSILRDATGQPKYLPNQEIGSTKIAIDSMKIKSVEQNGDGSHASVRLEVIMKKLSKDALGGKLIPKEIQLSANLCKIDRLTGASHTILHNQCKGSGKKIIDGLKLESGSTTSYWALCQDCNGVTANSSLKRCQGIGGGSGGVDLNNVSRMACVDMGGTFDDTTNTCIFDGKTISQILTELKTNACDFETQIVDKIGGTTKNCNPNFTVTYLYGNLHKSTACPGSLHTFNGDSICKISSSTCPSGWQHYKYNNLMITETTAGSGSDRYVSEYNDLGFAKTCANRTIYTGSHSFTASETIESTSICNSRHNSVDGCLKNCQSSSTIYASRTAVGCY